MKTNLMALGFVAVSACSGSSTVEMAQSGFRTPGADGLISGDSIFTSVLNAQKVEDADGDGFAYSLGTVSSNAFGAYAGILPTTDVEDAPTTGSITFDATYTVRGVDEIEAGSNGLDFSCCFGRTDDITLVADFDDSTLTGTSTLLTVNGQITGNGNELAGSVTWDTLEAELTGVVGADKVVGAFHASDEDPVNDTYVFSGGFLGAPAVP